MVKNQGGNKSKKVARKSMTAPQNKNVREKDPKEPCEMYATMVKLYGGPICEVICEDGISRLCVIRSKFRGRGKHDNFMAIGVLVLIGLRDYEVRRPDKKETCDLLCVYREDEKTKLVSSSIGNWGAISATAAVKTEEELSSIMFEDENTADATLMKTIQDEMTDGQTSNVITYADDEIDIDDI